MHKRVVALAAALVFFSVACQVSDQHGVGSAAAQKKSPDPMEELKYSKFCTEGAEKFWSRHDWKDQRDLSQITSYTSHYNLIQWAHGLVRDGWRVLRTSNRYAFATFLTIRRILVSIAASNGQRHRGVPTSFRSLNDIAAEARSFSFPTAPSSA